MNLKLSNSFSDWEVGSDYHVVRQIGSGSYGFVAEAIHKPTGQKVAIKKLHRIFEDNIDCKRILREIKLLRNLRHPYVVQLIDIIEPKNVATFDTLYLVLEYAQTDVKKLVKSSIHLLPLQVQTIVYNLLCGLKYVHTADVLHRDLKPANILLNEDCSVKICDFGLARSVAGVEIAKFIYKKESPGESSSSDPSRSPEKGSDNSNNLQAPFKGDDADMDMEFEEEDVDMEAKEEDFKHLDEDSKKKAIHSKLLKTKDLRKNMKRELTGHVVTRWYRAPELILLEKDYGFSIDIWSVGCIFAELLSTIKENAATYLDRTPLFPGNSCFPLSPDTNSTQKRGGFPFSSSDQLNMIFEIIGTPTEEDYSFVTDAKALEYLKSFPTRTRKDLYQKYPAAGNEALDLLDKILVFNPYFRINLNECIAHPYFAKVRDARKELEADHKVTLEFEKEGDLDGKRLRELFIEEIMYFKHRRESGV